MDAWLLAVMAGVLYLPPGWARHEPVLLVVELALAGGIPTGVTALWLARTRRRQFLGMAVVQAVGALLAYPCGIVAAAVILEAVWTVA